MTGTAPRKKTEGRQPMMGRPSSYNPLIAKEICDLLSDGIPLREICRSDPKFPKWNTVYEWMYRDDALGDQGTGLSQAIEKARNLGYDALAEECLAIADDGSNDWMERLDSKGEPTGAYMLNGDHVQRSKLRIDTRLKLLAKFNPKKYGDKVTHAGDDQNPLVVENNHNVFGELLQALKMERQVDE